MAYIVYGKKGYLLKYAGSKSGKKKVVFGTKTDANAAKNIIKNRIKKKKLTGWKLHVKKL